MKCKSAVEMVMARNYVNSLVRAKGVVELTKEASVAELRSSCVPWRTLKKTFKAERFG